MKRFPILVAALLTLAVGGSTARADPITVSSPITITSGVLSVGSGVQGTARISISGDHGFTFTSTLDRNSRVDVRACGQWLPCGPGAIMSLVATWSGLDLRNGTATLDGSTYPRVGASNSPNQMWFEVAGTTAAPDFGRARSVSLTAPFTLDGLFRFGESATGPTDFLQLAGSGTATVRLRRGTGDLANTWVYQGVRYEFASTPLPTPEPASLVLLGSGLAFVVGRARWRKR